MRWRILALLLGALIDALVGDPEWFPHPVRFIGRFIRLQERWIRSRPREQHRIWAVALTLCTAAVTGGIACAVLSALRRIGFWPWLLGSAAINAMCISAKCMVSEARGVARALRQGLDAARRQVARIVGRDTAQLSAEEVVKATVETVAENTTDGVISPIFWILLAGPVGGMCFKAVSTLDSMVGYRDERYVDIGWCSARADDALNWLPARLTALLMVLAAFAIRLDGRNAWRITWRDHANHLSPNCAWSEAAAAGAMHIQLGGTHDYFGKPVVKPSIGDDDRPAVVGDIASACRLLVLAEAGMLLLSISVAVLILG